MDVTTHASVEEFFREVVLEALREKQIGADEFTEHYLVSLLGAFAKSRIPDGPLSLRLAAAQAPAERVKALKEVGDTSLYVAGFFADSLDRKVVDTDFYIQMGEAAYRELAARLVVGSSSVARVYDQLASNFPRFVDVLAEVRARVDLAGADVGKLYQQWLSTRADWIERRLRRLGVVVGGSGGGYLQ